jgi:putative ABC transport system ATP-binding protein
METKISIKDVSAPADSILETGAEIPRLEGELSSGEGRIASNEKTFKCELDRSRDLQSDKTHGKTAPVIEVIDVKKSYILGDMEVPVLHDINLEVREGEFLAIMGPSGSGKSTLMNLIGFLDRPTEGRIIIKGFDINKLSDKEIARLRGLEIGFIFQTFNLIPRLTALENVELPTYANTRSGVDTHERAKELLKLVGLEDRMHHKPGELSGGQSQRVAIARALVNDPAILLADEPTGNLDSKTGCEILNMFRRLNEEGRTIVMITHDPEIAGFAERIVLVKDGIIQTNTE